MVEYIDREKLMEKFCWNCDATACGDDECFYKRTMYSIPPADVQPVVHGKWEEVQEWMGDVEYSCSVCGCYALWKELTTDQVCTEYCPHCGARMDGET